MTGVQTCALPICFPVTICFVDDVNADVVDVSAAVDVVVEGVDVDVVVDGANVDVVVDSTTVDVVVVNG